MKSWPALYIFLTAALYFIRIVVFADRYGGIEHDSGWYLGVARNMAERGIYASYTNTIREEIVGPGPSIHGRFSVQDKRGFSYFPAGVTAGPGYVIPQAILLKFFGYSWWQYRLWPLISFFAMLVLLFYFTFYFGGLVALFLLQAWVWLLPQLFIPLAYEAFAEPIALFYLLLSFYFLVLEVRRKAKQWTMLATGVAFSLSILTKTIYILAAPALISAAVYDLWKNRKPGKMTIWPGVFLALGIIIPIFIFELYRFQNLTSSFGINGWEAINKDILLHFRQNGSGISLKIIDWNFVIKKATLWKEVAVRSPFLAWALYVIAPLTLFCKEKAAKRLIFILFYFTSLAFFSWFLALSPTGWTRHVWPALILGMAVIASFMSWVFRESRGFWKMLLIIVCIVFMPAILALDKFEPRFLVNQQMIEMWEAKRYETGLQGLPTNVTLSLADQREITAYFPRNIKDNDRIYYLGWFLVAELPPLVDKVFYTLDRYLSLEGRNPDGGLSYLILGPYQKGRLSLVSQNYHQKKISALCEVVIFNNPSYTLCKLRENILYINTAYE